MKHHAFQPITYWMWKERLEVALWTSREHSEDCALRATLASPYELIEGYPIFFGVEHFRYMQCSSIFTTPATIVPAGNDFFSCRILFVWMYSSHSILNTDLNRIPHSILKCRSGWFFLLANWLIVLLITECLACLRFKTGRVERFTNASKLPIFSNSVVIAKLPFPSPRFQYLCFEIFKAWDYCNQ